MSIITKIKKLSIPLWSIPIFLLLLIILGYGLFITQLGFYQDDWYLMWDLHRFGPSIYLKSFAGERPFLAGVYILTTSLIGESALRWHIFSLFTKWLAVLAGWWALRVLWPQHTRQVTWIAALFAIYPGFHQHYLAVTYSQYYLVMAAFLVSIGAMLKAIRQPLWRWPLTLLALAGSVFSLVSTEYFFGLELLRPVLLWLVLSEQPRTIRERMRLTLIHWTPYLVATVAFAIWRMFFYESTKYTEPKLILRVAANPITGILNFLHTVIQDGFEAYYFAWTQTMDFIKQSYTSPRQLLLPWLFILVITVGTAFYLNRLSDVKSQSELESGRRDNWSLQACFLGLYASLVAGLPFWYAGLAVSLILPDDRFTMAFMFGSAIFTVGLVDLLIKSDRIKVVLVSTAIGLAVLFQWRVADSFREVHEIHDAIYRQLVWRAPGLEPGTKVLLNQIPYEYSGNGSLNALLNWIYTTDESQKSDLYRLLFIPGKIGSPELPNLEIGSQTDTALVVYYSYPGCLLVMDPLVHTSLPRLPAEIIDALPVSHPEQILTSPGLPEQTLEKIFGRKTKPDWCYFFELADLARQRQDWQRIVALGEQATASGLSPAPKHYREYLPFIEGNGRQYLWVTALKLTKYAMNDSPSLEPALCEAWNRIIKNTVESPERTEVVNKLGTVLSCPLP